MTEHHIDSNRLRAELRTLPRGTLLLIAERAIELVTRDQLDALLGDIVQINVGPADARSDDSATIVVTSLLDEVRAFHDAAMDGAYYDVEINNKGQPEQSGGTDAFIAEFDRLMRKCVGALEADTEPRVGESLAREVRDCFELLFALLRHVDEGNDDVLFFSDDGSSLDVGVNWRVALPAYFQCVAETEATSPEEFARMVDEAIAEFAEYDRPRYMDAARTVANDAQRIAMMSK
jgi:hypothetical protein